MTFSGDKDRTGPIVKGSWVTSRQAVAAFNEFCLARRWLFTEVPEQTDFGKDGYLDFSEGGHLTGQCIAVQVKGGQSFRRSQGYVVRADVRRRTLWFTSTVPVFGIVWDPTIEKLFWLNLTAELQSKGIDSQLRVPVEQCLEGDGEKSFLQAMWQATAGSPVAAALGSDDAEVQDAAVFDIYGLGRRDPRYLVLLRRVMFGLAPEVLDRAIFVLNQCSLNPDNILDSRWLSMEGRQLVRQQFLWSIDEAVALLDRTQDDDAFERGSFSSCIYWLLVGPEPFSPHFLELAETAALRAIQTARRTAAQWGLVLSVYWAGTDGPATFDRLTTQAPEFRGLPVVEQVREHLNEFGYLSIG